jgi:cytochrome c biogenesis protein CcdA
MSGLSSIGLLTSFGAGIASFLFRCVLPLVPGYVSVVAGDTLTASGEPAGRLAALRLSLCFVLGFSTVFVILGASATSLGQLLLSYRYEANLLGGAVVIPFGLFMMRLANPWWMHLRVPLPSEPQRWAPCRRLPHRYRLRLWLDPVHRLGARRDPDDERRLGHRAARRGAAEPLFARFGAADPSPQRYSPRA